MPSAPSVYGGLARSVLRYADGPRGAPDIPPLYVGTLLIASTIPSVLHVFFVLFLSHFLMNYDTLRVYYNFVVSFIKPLGQLQPSGFPYSLEPLIVFDVFLLVLPFR